MDAGGSFQHAAQSAQYAGRNHSSYCCRYLRIHASLLCSPDCLLSAGAYSTSGAWGYGSSVAVPYQSSNGCACSRLGKGAECVECKIMHSLQAPVPNRAALLLLLLLCCRHAGGFTRAPTPAASAGWGEADAAAALDPIEEQRIALALAASRRNQQPLPPAALLPKPTVLPSEEQQVRWAMAASLQPQQQPAWAPSSLQPPAQQELEQENDPQLRAAIEASLRCGGDAEHLAAKASRRTLLAQLSYCARKLTV